MAWVVGLFFIIYFTVQVISPTDTTPETTPVSRISNVVDQEVGRKFIGMTKADLIEELGEPLKTISGSNPDDGDFEILTYDESKGNSTLFTIWKEDGYVSSGQYKGKHFFKKQ